MRKNLSRAGGISRLPAIRTAIILAAASLCGSANSAPNSPVGKWDCTISGSGQQGIAFLTFFDDGTFSGYRLLVGKLLTSASVEDFDDSRNSGGDASRQG